MLVSMRPTVTRRVSAVLVACLLLASVFSFLAPHAMATTLTPHYPIYIDGSHPELGYGFTPENGVTGGTGTSSDPYVISGWDILSDSDAGIEIRNTEASFVIRNVYVHDGGLGNHGIIFNNVANGRVENSALSYNFGGWEIIGSRNVAFVENNVTTNPQYYDEFTVQPPCIEVYSSSGVVISGNTGSCLGGSILASSSDHLLVFHNSFRNFDGANATPVDSQGSQNSWDDGYPSGGNYWGGLYRGVDNCSGPQQDTCPSPDGMGDTPYIFSSGQDRYPLMKPFTPQASDPQFQQTFTFDGVVVSVFGSLTPDTTSRTVTGTVSVTVTNSTTGQTVFSKTFSVSVSYGSSSLARFVLSLPTSSSWLGATCSVNVSTNKAGCTISRDPDVDHNGSINLLDVSQVFLAYGLSIGDARYNPSLDLYGYGIVNLFDASLAALDYGLPVFS